ncbi:MAG: FxLYD domain-containing protein [Planctomycetes bacterium]|nr:FxLYD domain-containing protein [Planctomycetota bacterium]
MYRQLQVVSHDAKQTSGKYSTVSGRVRNQTNEKSTSVHVFAVGYDSTGAACSFVDAYVSGSGIEPGAEGEFKLSAGIWQTELPKRWELTAWGRATK